MGPLSRLRAFRTHLPRRYPPSAAAAAAAAAAAVAAGGDGSTVITEVRCYCVKLPDTRMFVVVKVQTAGGLYGVGESGLSFRELAVKGCVEHFAQFLVGMDARNISALWQQMYRSQYFEGGRALTAAMSAIDIALHDVMGKHLKCPVYQLLGTSISALFFSLPLFLPRAPSCLFPLRLPHGARRWCAPQARSGVRHLSSRHGGRCHHRSQEAGG